MTGLSSINEDTFNLRPCNVLENAALTSREGNCSSILPREGMQRYASRNCGQMYSDWNLSWVHVLRYAMSEEMEDWTIRSSMNSRFVVRMYSCYNYSGYIYNAFS